MGVTGQAPARVAQARSALPGSGITARGIVVGALGALAIGLGAPYATMVLRGSTMALDFSTPAAVFLLFVIVAGPNLLLRRLRPRLALSPADLITAYIMMVVACAIPTMGVTGQVLPLISAPYYYATPENKWEELIQTHMPAWVSPRGSETGARLITDFFEGSTTGVGVPWGAWLPALGVWVPFLLCLHFVMICMMVILRRQWADRERLTYPLTQLPLELCEAGQAASARSLLRSRVMWLGFAVPMIVGSFVGLHHYYPTVPEPALEYPYRIEFFRNMTIYLRLSFPMVGFFFLVNLETVFSLWFFNLLFFSMRGIMNVLNVELRESLGPFGTRSPAFAHVGMGAMIALVVGGLWIARQHLRDGWRAAVRRSAKPRPDENDSHEVLSYPVAWWGMFAGLIFIGVWLYRSGMPPLIVPILLFGAFVLFVGLTRIVVESGMAEAVASTIAPVFVISGFGVAAAGQSGAVSLGLTHVWCSDIRTFVMASCANSLKLAEVIEGRKRRLFGAMLLAIVVAMLSSIWLTLKWAYVEGGIVMQGWFFQSGPRAIYGWVAEKLTNPTGPNVPGWILTGVGAIVMVFLTVMRQRLVWWPFHPVGFCIGSIWMMDRLWFTAFLAWLAKAVVLRYGGLQTYRNVRPFFLGLILGQFTCSGLWLVLDQLTGHTGNRIFWI